MMFRPDIPTTTPAQDYPKPSITRDQVLVRIHATTVSYADHRLRALDTPAGFALPMRLIFGITAPRKHILGTELAGEVVQAGDRVDHLRPGDRVCAHPGATLGAHAEYIALPAAQCVKLPASIPMRTAAALAFGGTTALHYLRQAHLAPGERLLVVGAAGCVGSAAVQLGKHLGAHVTGVAGPLNQTLLTDTLGADAALDYKAAPLQGSFDVVMDCVGAGNVKAYRNLATGANPRVILVAGSLWDMLGMLCPPRGVRVVGGPVPESPALLQELVLLCEQGAYTPLLDEHAFTLDDIVAAHALVDTGHKRGSVIVDVVVE